MLKVGGPKKDRLDRNESVKKKSYRLSRFGSFLG